MLRDMLRNADIAYGSSLAEPELFDKTPALKYTVLYALLIVGEASKVSSETRALLPEVPWADIVATRHFVAHGYDRVDPEVILGIAQDDLPPLMDALRRLVDTEEPAP